MNQNNETSRTTYLVAGFSLHVVGTAPAHNHFTEGRAEGKEKKERKGA